MILVAGKLTNQNSNQCFWWNLGNVDQSELIEDQLMCVQNKNGIQLATVYTWIDIDESSAGSNRLIQAITNTKPEFVKNVLYVLPFDKSGKDLRNEEKETN